LTSVQSSLKHHTKCPPYPGKQYCGAKWSAQNLEYRLQNHFSFIETLASRLRTRASASLYAVWHNIVVQLT